jgi:threonine dehydratase
MNFSRLRFVAERADVGQSKEAVFAIAIPEERGSFKRLCSLIGTRNVTEFNYRISDSKKANIFIGISTQQQGDSTIIAKEFIKSGFDTIDLTTDELAKSHLRHMVGGRSSLADNELLYRFEFPERPGALMNFLNAMSPHWNISLFHYRNHGGDYGKILVGMQVPKKNTKELNDFLKGTGYRYWDESQHPAYQLFLK